MGADCFHILCNFPFLNEKSGAALDLNYCLGAKTLRFQSMYLLQWQVCHKATASSPAKFALCCRAPCATSEEGPAEGRDGLPKAAFT